MKSRNLLHLLFIIPMMLSLVSCQPEKNKLEKAMEAPRLVVAHYMEYQPMYGNYPDISVTDVKKEIIDAHDQGVDAFQINIVRWKRESAKNITAKLFQAASEVSFPFFLFLSTDNHVNHPGWTFEEVLDYMQLYGDHPNQLKVDGRPLLTDWSGDHLGTDFWSETKDRLKSEYDIDIFYVPFHGLARGQSAEEIDAYLDEWESIIDGYWSWGGSTPVHRTDSELYTPAFNAARRSWDPGAELALDENDPNYGYMSEENTSVPESSELLSDILESRDIPFMSPVTPSFWAGCWNSCKYTEHHGGAGIESLWTSIIENQDARWINLVTWNDMGEDTHWSPNPYSHLCPNKPTLAPMYSHAGFAELNKYYIQWWKSYEKPEIEKDKLFFFHRNQFGDAIPLKESCPMECSLKRPDWAYVTTMLPDSAMLIIHSGSKITEYDVPAGIHHWRGPLGLGDQRFLLVRNGETVIDVTSQMPVVEIPEYKSWSFYSGFAEAMY
ncbi:MAG: endo-1,3-alpha-glucanase family glycosylhydrolase [Bacteroidales bacterium]